MTKINGVDLKEAESREEKKLLGLISQISKSIDYGKFTIELSVRGGKLTHVEADYRVKPSVNLQE